MQAPRVVAWAPAGASLRLMARATAESAARGAGLCLLSTAPAPVQWSTWREAAGNLGVMAGWRVVAARPRHGGLPDAFVAEAAGACLVVTEAASLRGAVISSMVRQTNLYVVAEDQHSGRVPMREPAVMVAVAGRPDDADLLSVANHEATLRHRQLIVVHAQSGAVAQTNHVMEHRWLDALSLDRQSDVACSGSRLVVTHGSVVDALRDHAEIEDVLVVGVRSPEEAHDLSIGATFFEAPPCDLLLTPSAGAPAAREPGHARHRARTPQGLDLP